MEFMGNCARRRVGTAQFADLLMTLVISSVRAVAGETQQPTAKGFKCISNIEYSFTKSIRLAERNLSYAEVRYK